MYFKVYRRRRLALYSLVGLLFFGFVLYLNQSLDDHVTLKADERNVVVKEQKVAQVKENQEAEKEAKKERVNIYNYVPPGLCNGCPGENGHGVHLTAEESVGIDEVYKKEFFNLRASDKISLWRSVPDSRSPGCKSIKYPTDLPTASIVFIFKNERWSPVLRSVYSVINRSPRHLLKEVILVDDQSDLDEMKQPLDDYCEKHFGDIVKILRAPKRLGLIAAKNYGGEHATGDVVVFLDAHIEASDGWLEPLLARIKEKRSAVLIPTIDNIDHKTMFYSGGGSGGYGIFTWSMFFTWGDLPPRIKDKITYGVSNYPTPVMPGGLFAIDRKYFFETGAYDGEMEVWGGENLELSFKTWQCGGSLEMVPCSHVGHIFRPGHPYNMTGEKGLDDVHGRNSMRVAEVWMDDYKRLYYNHRQTLRGKDCGDISGRLALRKKLNCKSFKWFLDNVYPEKFIPDENVIAYGEVKNVIDGVQMCLDTLGKPEQNSFTLGVFYCQAGKSASQFFSFSKKNELRREESCCSEVKGEVRVDPCLDETMHKWKHTKGGAIMEVRSGLCLDVTGVKSGEMVKMNKCDPSISGQQWTFQNYLEETKA